MQLPTDVPQSPILRPTACAWSRISLGWLGMRRASLETIFDAAEADDSASAAGGGLLPIDRHPLRAARPEPGHLSVQRRTMVAARRSLNCDCKRRFISQVLPSQTPFSRFFRSLCII